MTPNIDQLRSAIKRLHGCDATHVESVPVKETFWGQTAWEGVVEVFAIEGHDAAKRCYAWSYEEASEDRRYVAVLELPPVTSARTAVMASIAAASRNDIRLGRRFN